MISESTFAFFIVSMFLWGFPLSMVIYNLADLTLEKRVTAKHKNIDWYESHGWQKRWFGYVKPKNK